jgi:hypothetical protein
VIESIPLRMTNPAACEDQMEMAGMVEVGKFVVGAKCNELEDKNSQL